MRDILISESITGAAVDRLSARFNVVHLPELWKNPELLAERIRNASALIVRNQTRVTRDVLRAARELLVVSRAGAGLDNIDVEAATEAGILITYAPNQNSISAAEHTMALLLALAHRVTAADVDTKAGGWNRHRFFGHEIYGKRLGIIGLGKIGYLTAMRAQAFGMNILACDPQVSRDNVYVAQLNAQLVDLEELLENADFVWCHVPSNVQTIGMLNRERIAKMKPTSCIINTARGEVIEEADLGRCAEIGQDWRRRPRCARLRAAGQGRTRNLAERDPHATHLGFYGRSPGPRHAGGLRGCCACARGEAAGISGQSSAVASSTGLSRYSAARSTRILGSAESSRGVHLTTRASSIPTTRSRRPGSPTCFASRSSAHRSTSRKSIRNSVPSSSPASIGISDRTHRMDPAGTLRSPPTAISWKCSSSASATRHSVQIPKTFRT